MATRTSLEAQAFLKHMPMFEGEQDCSCILAEFHSKGLLLKSTVEQLLRIGDRISRNRYSSC